MAFIGILSLLYLMILLGQIFEWTAMLYIIHTQKKRDVNQILYEHNAEPMGENYSVFRRSRFR